MLPIHDRRHPDDYILHPLRVDYPQGRPVQRVQIGGAAVAGVVMKVDYATTENITPSGILTIDGSPVGAKEKILVWKQTDAADNGVYQVVADDEWTYLGQPQLVAVAKGATLSLAWFILQSENTYKAMGAAAL